MKKNVQFVFKGNRDYVQGTSLFNSIVKNLADQGVEKGVLDVSFRKMVCSPVCVIEDREFQPEDAVTAHASSDETDKAVTLVLYEADSSEDPVRVDFDEDAACEGARVDGKSITIMDPKHKDLIELVVSLCKKLHLAVVADSKKWVFSRYLGQFPIPEAKKVEIRIVKQVGVKLTKSDVLVNDEKIADLFFS
ncbi:hypothetical protein [Alcanivorax sp.]|uniref:hypothetical protein n=1 Tax=Alcanivorax sp. TaxID=1872427 RepID=UPI002625E591|nr:hypothetical protein [Alcanivorax sp.]